MNNSSGTGKTDQSAPENDLLRMPVNEGQTAALLKILQLEADIRRVPSERELVFHIANECRSVLGYRQAFVFRRRYSLKLSAVSSVSAFDRQSPVNKQFEKLVNSLSRDSNDSGARTVNLGDFPNLNALNDYVFQHAIWVPLCTQAGREFAGVLILSETQWPESTLPLVERIAETYAHAWQGISKQNLDRNPLVSKKAAISGLLLALMLAGFIQMPLTVLAPVEVTGEGRRIIAAPMNGTVEEVLISPNSSVELETLLIKFDDTELRNSLEISEQEVVVAQASLTKLQSASFTDREAARDLKIAEAELELAQARRQLVRGRLDRAQIRAEMAGVAVFEDASKLIGQPVNVGDVLLEIVNPAKAEFSIRLPVSDSVVLKEDARVRVFLDSEPLKPVDSRLIRRSYRATTHADGSFAYTLTAAFEHKDGMEDVRIGTQGTAQIFGDDHSLYFIIFRRPLSWLRQTLGF